MGGLEDCLELVRRALQRAAERGGGARATPCSPGWDADTTLTLSHHDAVRPEAIRYLNRLSDLLFVLCRVLARASGHGEVLWRHDRRR